MKWQTAWQIVKGFRGARAYPELYQRVARDFELSRERKAARSAANRKAYRYLQHHGGIP